MSKSRYVPPSGLLSRAKKETISSFKKNLNNTPLKMGVVSKIYNIDDEKNMTKLFVEYDVITSEQNGQLGQSFITYSNCLSLDAMGGLGDFFEFKRRTADKEDFNKTYDFAKQDGSVVIILCLDGHTDKGVIIGGLPNPNRKTSLTTDADLHLEGEYNGLNWKVDKDGALTVTFKSATDNSGKPQDEAAGGTSITIDKTGSVDLNSGDGTSIKLDKAAKDISITAGNNITNTSSKDIEMNAGGKFSAKSTADFLMEAGGSAKFSSKSKIAIEGKGDVSIKGSAVKVESDGSITIKGSTVEIDAPSISLGKGGTPAVTLMTKFMGVGNLAIPVICSAIGPFSTAVKIK